MNEHKIDKITVSVGSGCLVFLESVTDPAVSISSVVDMTLMTAFIVKNPIALEFFEGGRVIKRVNAFYVNQQAKAQQISRLATQMNPVSGLGWLELFVIQADNHTEKQFRVVDPLIQQLCHSAAITKQPLKFLESNEEIYQATIMDQSLP